tara:strand:- start:29 stop:235 length:207 start_codon:yes stop_codon:yes gene_type:complete
MKAKVIKPVFVKGSPFKAGEVVDLDEGAFNMLSGLGKVEAAPSKGKADSAKDKAAPAKGKAAVGGSKK